MNVYIFMCIYTCSWIYMFMGDTHIIFLYACIFICICMYKYPSVGRIMKSAYGNSSSILHIPEISKSKIAICKNDKNYKNLIILSKEITIL
jgi:hypothetical protein